ncbi:hypothetical protein BH11ARM1_BH11ARM1_11270 [soil metagenome]
MGNQAIIEVERGLWTKSSDKDFFNASLADNAISVVEPMGFIDKESAIGMIQPGSEWTDLVITDEQFVDISADVRAFLYHATAKNALTGEPYRASVCSVYSNISGDWKLALTVHQPWPESK